MVACPCCSEQPNPNPTPKMKKHMITIHTRSWNFSYGAWTENRVTFFRPASRPIPTVRGAARMIARDLGVPVSSVNVVRVESAQWLS